MSPNKKNDGHIYWSHDEYERIALDLLERHPELNPLHSSDLRGMNRRMVMEAMQRVLPPERHRIINDFANKARRGLLRAYERMRKRTPPGEKPTLLVIEPEPTATESAAPLAPPPPESLPPEPAADAVAASDASHPHPKRVVWNSAEWLMLAREIHRQAPAQRYPFSATLAGLAPEAVRAAQTVLPPERRRLALHTMTPLRDPLLDAFKIVRSEIEHDEREHQALLKKEQEEKAAQEALAAAQKQTEEILNSVSTAQRPSLETLLSYAAEAMADIFANTFITRFATHFKALPFVSEAPPSAPRPEVHHEKPPAVPRAAKILIVGPMPQQAHDIEKAFPHVRFSIFSGHNPQQVKDAAKYCDRAIGMTKFMNHPIDGTLAKMLGERYTRVAGGVSDIKRQIDVWIHAGILPQAPAMAV